MDPKSLTEFVDRTWDESIVPSLVDYIRIPNKSPLFDPDWEANGHMERAVTLIWTVGLPLSFVGLLIAGLEALP